MTPESAGEHGAGQPVALITGAGAGIGRACAVHLAADGYRIAALDADGARLERLAPDIAASGGEILAIAGDVGDPQTSARAARACLDRWGRIDVLVANAGIQSTARLLDTDDALWNRVLSVNLNGVAHACRAVLPSMIAQRRGAIVMISSVNALLGARGSAAYDASKAAVLGLMRNLAQDYGQEGIRVNAVCPGNTLTDYHLERMAGRGVDEQALREMCRGYGLLGRAAEPGEIASVVAFLAGDGASFMTGQAIAVDGGFTLSRQT